MDAFPVGDGGYVRYPRPPQVGRGIIGEFIGIRGGTRVGVMSAWEKIGTGLERGVLGPKGYTGRCVMRIKNEHLEIDCFQALLHVERGIRRVGSGLLPLGDRFS
jgi:hypothetical protein